MAVHGEGSNMPARHDAAWRGVNNIVEPHIDAYKLCTNSRRPTPHMSDHIGLWGNFMAIQSNVAVLTNIGLILFTSDIFDSRSVAWKLTVFILAEHAMMTFKYVLAEVMPDEPGYVSTLKQRHEFVINRLFNAMEEDQDDHFVEEAEELDLEIHDPSFKMADAFGQVRFPTGKMGNSRIVI